MSKNLKIAIIGDFNFTYNAHHATNLAVEYSAKLLDINVNYYWIRVQEATQFRVSKLNDFDGIWLAPEPFENEFFLNGVLNNILSAQVPVLITGRGFKAFLEVIIKMYNLNPNQEKIISDNLAAKDEFEKVEVHPITKSLKSLYMNKSRTELTNSRYSIYPQILDILKKEVIDVEALNQFGEPEIISLKSRHFCVASMSLPQICSTRDMPHPLISAFFNYMYNINKKRTK